MERELHFKSKIDSLSCKIKVQLKKLPYKFVNILKVKMEKKSKIKLILEFRARDTK